jgi:hypothetical protein
MWAFARYTAMGVRWEGEDFSKGRVRTKTICLKYTKTNYFYSKKSKNILTLAVQDGFVQDGVGGYGPTHM